MTENSPVVKMFRKQDESAAFQEKSFSVDGPVIIGRAGATAQPTKTNGIFASYTMSKAHAQMFYNHVECKFYLIDSNSTNGTYVRFKSNLSPSNNLRLKKNPMEISSGDIVQFGVPAISKVTKEFNQPIVAILELYHPQPRVRKQVKEPSQPELDDYGNELSPSLLKMYK